MKRTASARKTSNGNGISTKAAKPSQRARFAVCIDNHGYTVSLEQMKIYRVVPDARAEADGDLRIIDESGEDYLFSANRFVVLDLPPKQTRTLGKSIAAQS